MSGANTGGTGTGGAAAGAAKGEAGARVAALGVVGRPNVGKSSLVNALCGQRGAVISGRAHTTAESSVWMGTAGRNSFALIDTPGVSGASAARTLRRRAGTALEGTLGVLAVFERELRRPQDALVEELACRHPGHRIGVLNKVDLLRRKELLLPRLEQLREAGFSTLVPVSARTGEGMELLRGVVDELLAGAEGQPDAPTQLLSEPDRLQRLQERLRANMLRHYDQEVPHQVSVELESESDKGKAWQVVLLLKPARRGQSAILLSRGGSVLRAVEAATARDTSAHLGYPVRLRLRVQTPRRPAKAQP